jgi:hypothetical protein
MKATHEILGTHAIIIMQLMEFWQCRSTHAIMKIQNTGYSSHDYGDPDKPVYELR